MHFKQVRHVSETNAVSTDQWKHQIDDQSSDDKIFLLLRTWKQVNETTNRITEHNRSMWWIFTHRKSGGSKSIAWPPTSKSGGSKDPLDPVLPRSMAIATWWLVLLFVFSWPQQSLHNALLINCRPNRVDSHQICQSGFEKPRFTGLHSLMTTNQQHRCKAHSTALLAYRMPNKVQLPTMVPPSCFLWIFVASSNIKSVVWRPFLL